MAGMGVRDFDCTLCARHFEMMYGDLIIIEELICDECRKELWPLEGEELRERVSRKLAKNARWLEERYGWHGEKGFEDRVVQSIQEIKRREANIAGLMQAIQKGASGAPEGKTTAPKAQEVVISRAILASPAQVYAAFTQAEGWRAWCCERAECDAQVGGKLHIYTDGYNAYGEFTELEEDRSAAFSWDGDGEPRTIIRVSLDRQDDGTVMTFQVTGLCSEQEWAGFAGTVEGIWGRVLSNLKETLEAGIDF